MTKSTPPLRASRRAPAAKRADADSGGWRALVAALSANAAIAITKIIAAIFTGSVVMVAEVAHSLADSSKQGLLMLGRVRSQRRPDPDHPFGYGPERYFWAFVVAILLFPIGALWAGMEAIEQLRDPQPISHAGWAAAVLFGSLVFEAISLRVAVREAREIDPEHSLWHFVRRSREPDIPSVLLEDAGAVAGAALGLLFLGAAEWTGDARWDAAGGLAVAGLLLGIGGVLCIEFKSLLIGEAALPEDRAKIRETIVTQRFVKSVGLLRTLHLSPDELFVLVRVTLDPELDAEGVADATAEIGKAVDSALPISTTVHVAPESHRASHPDPPEGPSAGGGSSPAEDPEDRAGVDGASPSSRSLASARPPIGRPVSRRHS